MDEYSPGFIAGCVAVVLAIIVGVFFLVTMTWASVPPDKIMLHYTGGPFQGTKFKEIVQPGTGTKFYGLRETLYYLPITQRSYTFSSDPNQGDRASVDFLSGPSSDNVIFRAEATVYFKLNTEPHALQQFMEQVCLHESKGGEGNCTDLGDGKGWDQMLNTYFRPAIEQAFTLAVRKYDRAHLYSDGPTLTAVQDEVGKSLKQRIAEKVGGEYFCGPDATASSCPDFGFVVKNMLPPDNVIAEYANTAAAAQSQVTAQNAAAAKVAAAQGDADAQNIRASAVPLSPEQNDYIRAQAMQTCASRDGCTLIITDGGANVNINATPR